MAKKTFTPYVATHPLAEGKNLEALRKVRIRATALLLTENQVKMAAERAASLKANGWEDLKASVRPLR